MSCLKPHTIAHGSEAQAACLPRNKSIHILLKIHGIHVIFFFFLSSVCFLQVSNESSYQEVVRATCGKVTGIACEVAIAVYTFGTCIAFFIVIGDQLDRCKSVHTSKVNHSQSCPLLINPIGWKVTVYFQIQAGGQLLRSQRLGASLCKAWFVT